MSIKTRDWVFLHWWIRPVVNIWFGIYHKSVTYSGKENIDWQKPTIFVPSHQNAFSDALCLILPTNYTNDRFIYPLARADAFGIHKAIDWLLTAFHILPVYRPQDNVNLKEENEVIFEHCKRLLTRNRNLLIHGEGICIPLKQVGSFKKGFSHIAFGAENENDFELGVRIIPVGINYRVITDARKGIHIRFGKPIEVADYKELYREHAATAINRLTREVQSRVKNLTIDIEPEEYQISEQLLRLKKSHHPELLFAANYSSKEVQFEKDFINAISGDETRVNKLTDALKNELSDITILLKKQGLDTDLSISKKYPAWRLAVEAIGFVILLPVFIYGALNNIIPWLLIHRLANKIKEEQFKSSARMTLGLAAFPLLYMVQGMAFLWITGSWKWMLVYLISLPVSGVLAINIYEKWKLWKQQYLLQFGNKNELRELHERIESLLNSLQRQVASDNN